MHKTRILFLSEEDENISFLEDVLLNVSGYETRLASDGEDALEAFRAFSPQIAVVNLDGKLSPSQILNFSEKFPEAFFLGFGKEPSRVPPELRERFYKILSSDELRVRFMTDVLDLKKWAVLQSTISDALQKIVGQSPPVKRMKETIFKAIRSKGATVLIEGESGTGKELVAKAIASVSSKFISVNCSAISESLFESELFGHVRGAFTGAMGERKGLFEAANGGILFLDEVGDIPHSMQAKFLRALQEGEIRPVGANEPKKVKVQIIAATNHDLRSDAEQGLFRKDLYYRLNVIPIHVPPLRERKEDIPELIEHFIREFALPAHPEPRLSAATLQRLVAYDWPGNIRELENAIHRAIVLMDGDELSVSHLLPEKPNTTPSLKQDFSNLSFKDFQALQKKEERDFIRAKLRENGGSVKRTAESFGMQRTALYAHAARIGLDLKSLRHS